MYKPSLPRGHIPARPRRLRAFTIVEIIVVVSIILVLAALLMPVVKKGTAMAKSAQCINNLHELGVVFGMYEGDNNKFPPSVFNNTTDPQNMSPTMATQSWSQGGTSLDVYVSGSDRTINITHLSVCPATITGTVSMGSLQSVQGWVYYSNYTMMAHSSAAINANGIHGRSRNSLIMVLDDSTNNPVAFANRGWGGNTVTDYTASCGSTIHLGKTSILWADNHVSQLNYKNLQAGDFDFTQPPANR